MSKSIAIVAFAETTRDMVHDSSADEIWSVNWAWMYGLPRIDRLFDMHPRWHLTVDGDKMTDHWRWLQEPHDFPIYMIEEFPEVPACVLYPIDEVIANVGRPYFTSGVSYMLGLALLELGPGDRLEIYGVDMGTTTEYAYQKAGCEYLIGMAEGRGIDVFVPEQSKILRAGLYAYDGGFQVISRQTLEHIRMDYEKQRTDALANFHRCEAEFMLLKKQLESEMNHDKIKELEEQVKAAYMRFLQAKSGVQAIDVAVQVATHFIDHVDVKAPDLTIVDNIAVKAV